MLLGINPPSLFPYFGGVKLGNKYYEILYLIGLFRRLFPGVSQ